MSSNGQSKCDVLILSASYGEGHHQVSNALRDKLKIERPDWAVEIYDFFDHVDPIFSHVLHFSYQQVIKHFAHGYQWFYEATQQLDPDSKWQKLLNKMGQQKLLETIETLSPRVIVCTFPTPAGVVSQLKARCRIDVPLVTVITDVAVHSQWIHPYVDAYIVAASTVARKLKKRGIPPEKIHVTGIPLREQFEVSAHDESVYARYGLDPQAFTLMVMGGGNGLLLGISEICEQLGQLGESLQILAVTGTNKALSKKLQTIAPACKNPIHVLGYVENIGELMDISHLLLTKAGGVTIFEALAKKLPMVLYNALPGHEMSNAKFLIGIKAAIMANDEETAVHSIRTLMNQPILLKNMVKAIEPISKPMATSDAVQVILETVDGYQRLDSPSDARSEKLSNHLYA